MGEKRRDERRHHRVEVGGTAHDADIGEFGLRLARDADVEAGRVQRSEQAEVLADSFDDELNDPERGLRPARIAQDAQRLGVCIFVVEEATWLLEVEMEGATPPATWNDTRTTFETTSRPTWSVSFSGPMGWP